MIGEHRGGILEFVGLWIAAKGAKVKLGEYLLVRFFLLQHRGVPALAEPGVRIDRDRPVLVGEGDGRDSSLLHDPGEETPTAWAQLRREHHPSFSQGRSPGADGARRELLDEGLPARLPEDDRNEC